MSGGLRCPSCQGVDIDFSEAGGDAICVACGTVCEESTIVSSIEFADGAGGSSHVVGQFVSASCTKPYGGLSGGSSGYRGGRRYGFLRSSRETTLANGRKKIETVASSLRLGAFYVDSAHRLFAMAAQRNFTQGRKSLHVACACLYVICRQQESAHMLVDFSDILQVNVYALGATYLKFRRLLNLELPIIDPSLYIHRFAAKLDLAEKTSAVATTAMHVVQRMKRDWIQTGRRPAGICAAALLIGARAHGFHRSKDDVTKALRVCGMTVALRLADFRATPASKLTITEFTNTQGGGNDLGEHDPPSFSRGRNLPQLPSDDDPPRITAGDENRNGQENTTTETMTTLSRATKTKKKNASSSSQKRKRPPTLPVVAEDDDDRETMTIGQLALVPGVNTRHYEKTRRKKKNKEPDAQLMLTVAAAQSTSSNTNEALSTLPNQAASRSIATAIRPPNTQSRSLVAAGQEDAGNFDDIQDDEIDGMILSKTEFAAKKQKWQEDNKEYIQRQIDKAALAQARAEASGSTRFDDTRRGSRRKSRSSGGGGQHASSAHKKQRTSTGTHRNDRTAEQALIGVVEKKRLSRKINYDALKGIFGVDSTPQAEESAPPTVRTPQPLPEKATHQETPSIQDNSRNHNVERRRPGVQSPLHDRGTALPETAPPKTTETENIQSDEDDDDDDEDLHDEEDLDDDDEYGDQEYA